jgi:tetratricopeptide (TPR) repeat protein
MGKKLLCGKCQTLIFTPDTSEATEFPEFEGQSSPGEGHGESSTSRLLVDTGPDRSFGPYEIVEEIARGGMGIVFKAWQKRLKRFVALKVLKEGEGASEKQIRRFKRETEAAARLQHPNIVAVHEVGFLDGYHYFTMDLIEGDGLDRIIKRGRLSFEEALSILEEIARAIHYAHAEGIVHRDLKPANLILDMDGHPKITDFGLAKPIDQKSLSRTGTVVGTPFYMPPEQVKGETERIDQRVDIYALGVILYEMITGKVPFRGETTMEVYHRILHHDLLSPRKLNKKIPPEVETICLKAMEKDPEGRYATAEELADDIDRFLRGEPITAKPTGALAKALRRVKRNRAVAAVVSLVLLAVLLSGGVMAWLDRIEKVRERERNTLAERQSLSSEVQKLQFDAKSAIYSGMASIRDERYRQAIAKIEKGLKHLAEIGRLPKKMKYIRDEAHKLIAGLDLRPIYRDAYLHRGNAYRLLGDPASLDRSLGDYRKAAEYDPDHGEVFREMAELFRLRRQFEKAVEAMSRAIELQPASSGAFLYRGELYDLWQKPAEAIKDYSVVVHKEKDVAEATEMLDAEERTGAAARSDPRWHKQRRRLRNYMTALLKRGNAYMAMNLPEKALADFETVLDIDGSHYMAYLYRGRLHQRMGNPKEALEDFNEAISVDAARPDGYLYRGLFYCSERKYERALENFEMAAEKAPGCYEAVIRAGAVKTVMLRYDEARTLFEKVIHAVDKKRGRHRSMAYLHRGHLSRALGKWDDALRDYSKAVSLDPRYVDALLARATLHKKRKKLPEARMDADKVLHIQSSHPEGLVLLGEIRLKMGYPKEAIVLFDRALKLRPDSVRAYAGRGEAYVRCGKIDAARADYEKALALERTVESDAFFFFRKAEEKHEEAVATRKPEPYREALTYYARAIDLNPRYTRAYHRKAALYEAWGAFDESIATYSEAIASNPYGLDAYIARGLLLVRHAKDARAALDDFNTMLEINSKSEMAYVGRGLAYQLLGDLESAERELTKAIELNPDRVEAIKSRAEIYRLQGDEAKAKSDEDRCREIEVARKKKAEDFLNRATLLFHKRQYTQAIEALDESLKYDPTSSDAYRARGICYLKIGEFVSAVLDLSKALELNPRLADQFLDRMYQVRHVVDLEKVMTDLNRIVPAHPNDPAVIFVRGFFYVAKTEFKKFEPGDYEKGIRDFTRTLELNPKHVPAYIFRALLYMRKGDYLSAHRDLDQALRLDPKLAVAHYFRASLYSLEGELDKATVELEAAFSMGFRAYERVKKDHTFDPIRDHPRYKRLMGGK